MAKHDSTQPTAACTVCQPVTLQALLKAQPSAWSQWMALPRTELHAGQFLLRTGDSISNTWWIERGLLRSFYLDEQGRENNRGFHAEGDWVGHGLPPIPAISPCHIEAMETCVLVRLPYTTLSDMLRNQPELNGLMQEAHNSLMASHARREFGLLSHAPTERYQAFRANHTHLEDRIALHHVASYLGITNVSLSRIRRRLGLTGGR